MTSWRWNEKLLRYQDTATGKILSRDSVIAMAHGSIDASENVAKSLMQLYSKGMLSPKDMFGIFREEIKQEYIRQYLVGIGGRAQMTPSDWGSIGAMLKEQYKYLDNFLLQVLNGDVTNAQMQMRMLMYVNSSVEALERARAKVAVKWGADEERWLLGIAEHCPDCLALSQEGWQPIGSFPIPGAGETVCLTNCRCTKIYRNSETGYEFGAEI